MTNNRKKNIRLITACMLLSAVILTIDILTPLGVADAVLYVSVVLLTFWSPEKRFTIIVSIAVSLLTVIGFFLSPPGGEMWKVLFNRGLSLFIIWITAVLVLQNKIVAEKREQAVLERGKVLSELRVLRGLLPICASCKKIRDDKGYWNQIEVYITEHSEAEFSHGICPECVKKLYPEIKSTN